MRKKRFAILMSLAFIAAILLSFSTSARSIKTVSTASDYDIERGDQWEMLNSEVYILEEVLNSVGNDFSSYYTTTLRNSLDAAKSLLESTASTTAQLREMTDELSYLRIERNNPANHERYGCYTVAFTNNGGWSTPIYLYNWSDTSESEFQWPGEPMVGGYTNEYGQRQYYAFVPTDINNIVFSADRLEADGVYCDSRVRVQTVDLTVTGNTGFYLTNQKDGEKYQVGSWALKQPDYHQYIPVDPITPDPTEVQPIEQPTAEPTEKPSVIADIPTEPSDEFNIDDYIPNYGTMLDYYVPAVENQIREELRQSIIDATAVLAPGNNHTTEYIEKLNRIRNFAVTVYNDSRSAENELNGARYMLQAAIDDKSYKEIVAVMYQWFNMPQVEELDPTTPPATVVTPPENEWDALSNHIIGDADGDGAVTIMDATRIQRVLAEFDVAYRPIAERYACMIGSRLSIMDATQIQRHLAGIVTGYAIGEHFPS